MLYFISISRGGERGLETTRNWPHPNEQENGDLNQVCLAVDSKGLTTGLYDFSLANYTRAVLELLSKILKL